MVKKVALGMIFLYARHSFNKHGNNIMDINNATLTSETRAIFNAVYSQAIILYMDIESCSLGEAQDLAKREMDSLSISELQYWWTEHLCKGDILDLVYLNVNGYRLCIGD
jgi:hypothetical protein